MKDGRSDRWVKFHIKALDNPIFTTMKATVCKVAMICMAEANFKDKVWWDGQREVVIPRGSFPTSTQSLSAKYRLSRQEIRTAFVRLSGVHYLTTKATNHYTIVTVLNYDTYQGGDDCQQPTDSHATNQRPTNAQPTPNQRLTTPLECLESVDVLEENTEAVCSANLGGCGSLFDTSPVGEPQAKPRKTSTVQYTEDWKRWYAEFPRHESQGAGFKAWKKLTAEEKRLALSGLTRLLPSINDRISELGIERGCPHPATWLNARRWEDEPPAERVKGEWD